MLCALLFIPDFRYILELFLLQINSRYICQQSSENKVYAHILDEDRRRLADEMEQSFYKGKTEEAPVTAAPALDAEALASLLASNPELLKKALESVQLANNT